MQLSRFTFGTEERLTNIAIFAPDDLKLRMLAAARLTDTTGAVYIEIEVTPEDVKAMQAARARLAATTSVPRPLERGCRRATSAESGIMGDLTGLNEDQMRVAIERLAKRAPGFLPGKKS